MAVKITDKNKIPDLIKQLEDMKGRDIEAGVLVDGHQAMLAHVHEYGIDIGVTPRMRAYLHYRGIHLKKSTVQIHIPERSYIRAGWDDNKAYIEKVMEEKVAEVLEKGIDADAFLDSIGLLIESKLKDKLRSVTDPPLTDWTVSEKGSSQPLVDGGSLLDAITYEVK